MYGSKNYTHSKINTIVSNRKEDLTSSEKMAPTTRQTTRTRLPGDSLLLSNSTRQKMYNIRDQCAKFDRVYQQIILMNNEISQMETRIQRAKNKNSRIFDYSLRLRAVTMTGVRDMFLYYASDKAKEIDSMTTDLYNSSGIIWDDSMTYNIETSIDNAGRSKFPLDLRNQNLWQYSIQNNILASLSQFQIHDCL